MNFLEKLAVQFGIQPYTYDQQGQKQAVTEETLLSVLNDIGVPIGKASEAEKLLEQHESDSANAVLPKVFCSRNDVGDCVFPLNLTKVQLPKTWQWKLTLEDGQTHQGEIQTAGLPSSLRQDNDIRYWQPQVKMPLGYHTLTLNDGQQSIECFVIQAPSKAFQPPALTEQRRLWGFALGLEQVNSYQNWGIGDFGDLADMVEGLVSCGASVLNVQPMHALFPHKPMYGDPLQPSSRYFWNILYLNVERIDEYHWSDNARRVTHSPEFQHKRHLVRESEEVDLQAVMSLKLQVLEALYQDFRKHHLANHTHRAHEFWNFKHQQGQDLRDYAIFQALHESYHLKTQLHTGWVHWQEAFQSPHTPEVADFIDKHEVRIEFYEYLQWQASAQWDMVGRTAFELQLEWGVCQDLPMGVNPGGAETWLNQEAFALDYEVHIPTSNPLYALKDHGVPFLPKYFEGEGLKAWAQMLRTNMRYVGTLRVVPMEALNEVIWQHREHPTQHVAVRYPHEALLSVLILESVRNQCLVIGGSLAGVGQETRDEYHRLGILTEREFLQDKPSDAGFPAVDQVDPFSVVCTHQADGPTIEDYWNGYDIIASLEKLPELQEQLTIQRVQDRVQLLIALRRAGLLPEHTGIDPSNVPRWNTDLNQALHLYLARTHSALVLVQLADLFNFTTSIPLEQRGGSNRRQRMELPLQRLLQHLIFKDLVGGMAQERPGFGTMRSETVARSSEPETQVVIPRSTYRFQLHKQFNFQHVRQMIPYLKELGISHCYMSPFLKARPGSMHGYDIVDHSTINPEVGSWDDFNKLVDELHHNSMGQIMDIVPNHMGVMGQDNQWWLDVLENGRLSLHAKYFDIDWEPAKSKLKNKVLIPALGNFYGKVLTAGQLQLKFDPWKGSFAVFYYEHMFPVNPAEYATLLQHRLDILQIRLLPDNPFMNEFHSLLASFRRLAEADPDIPEQKQEYAREKEWLKSRLAALCAKCTDIRLHIDTNLNDFNGRQDDAESFEPLHNLLENQHYRLSHWRVAADEINYRRFFDINDLAALRMEDLEVFEVTHRLILELMRDGRVDGLRIDHPDGMANPLEYYERLQTYLGGKLHHDEEGNVIHPLPAYILGEKILASHERLPTHWPISGTTGYDFASAVNGILVDRRHEEQINRVYQEFSGLRDSYEEVLLEAKELIMRTSLSSELNFLATHLNRLSEYNWQTRDFTLNDLREGLKSILTYFSVYRTYVTDISISDNDTMYVDWAVKRAIKNSLEGNPEVLQFIQDVLLLRGDFIEEPHWRETALMIATRFQQVSSVVMAKSFEDTAFYRYHRLISLNEVGSDPEDFGVSLGHFHKMMQDKAAEWPHAMLSTSTHDTKRSEDVRCRINVLSEIPELFEKQLQVWSRLSRAKIREVEGEPVPDGNTEYFLYQILLGTWPTELNSEQQLEVFSQRINAYMLKAMREGKEHTSWTHNQQDYEKGLHDFIQSLLTGLERNAFIKKFLPFQQMVAKLGAYNSLIQTFIKLSMPGVPDIYQGNECYDFSLVDPDNRRPVDFTMRRELLDQMRQRKGDQPHMPATFFQELLENVLENRVKFYVVWAMMQIRKDHEDLFKHGGYTPLLCEGNQQRHLIAYSRSYDGTTLMFVGARFFYQLTQGAEHPPVGQVFGNTEVEIPNELKSHEFHNLLTGKTIQAGSWGSSLLASEVLADFPLAVLKAVAPVAKSINGEK